MCTLYTYMYMYKRTHTFMQEYTCGILRQFVKLDMLLHVLMQHAKLVHGIIIFCMNYGV